MNMDISPTDWRTSSKSNSVGNQCVEVAVLWVHSETRG
jgi:hypothetical protein